MINPFSQNSRKPLTKFKVFDYRYLYINSGTPF